MTEESAGWRRLASWKPGSPLATVSSLIFSDQITSGQKSYGPAGVCLHAGAVFGRMWNEQRAERAADGQDN